MIFPKIRLKTIEWLRRYGPAEIIGTAATFTAAFVMYHASGSYIAAAIAGTWGENIGYYGWFAFTEFRRNYGSFDHHAPVKRALTTAFVSVRNMVLEFGPAEAIDTFMVRPSLMYALPIMVGNFGVGIIAGKLFADILFYGITICGYEARKYWTNKNAMPDDEAI